MKTLNAVRVSHSNYLCVLEWKSPEQHLQHPFCMNLMICPSASMSPEVPKNRSNQKTYTKFVFQQYEKLKHFHIKVNLDCEGNLSFKENSKQHETWQQCDYRTQIDKDKLGDMLTPLKLVGVL